MYSLKEIADKTGSKLSGSGELNRPWQLLIDSRTLSSPENTIFFAIKTQYNDGHKFVPELINKGVEVFVVEKFFETEKYPAQNFIVSDNVIKVLQDLASFHRDQFNIPIIGITGSNGKTIVKEWLSELLSDEENICASPKSFNSQIGVPLSVWNLDKTHTLGIFEAGISAKGEMKSLADIIRPNIGILTHLGPAHNQGFDTPEEKISEKLLLFQNTETVLMAYQPEVMQKTSSAVLTFGFDQNSADLNISSRITERNSTQIVGQFKGKPIAFTIPFTDDASIENACLCCLCLLYLDKFKAEKFQHLSQVSMRMELKKGIHNCLLINDSYSNDLHALGTALSFLQQQSIHPKTSVIISDIEGSGLPAEILYANVLKMLKEKNVNRLIGIGKDFYRLSDYFRNEFETEFYESTENFIERFNPSSFKDESILVKGARNYRFERVIRKLEQESHGTVLEIDLSAALKNLNAIKSRLEPGIKIMAMVKAFAYGSGTYEMAKLIRNKVDYLAVAYSDEGVALRKNGIDTPIMVMNPEEESYDQIVEYHLEPVVFSINQLKSMLNFLHEKDISRSVNVHVELDTGMHRLGFTIKDIDMLCAIINENPLIKMVTVFSHLSASDEKQYDDFTNQQFQSLKSISERIEQLTGKKFLKHISNTAAILRFGQEGLDMIRLGIGLYGIDPTGEFKEIFEPVFTLKTVISQIKEIGANESVGYSRKSISDKKRKIAILALGYADGLNRGLSNGIGAFQIRGKMAPIAGNICMDMCMVDVTEIDCEEGDEAILFGKNLSIETIANKLNTIPYEILTSISQRVKRVYVSE